MYSWYLWGSHLRKVSIYNVWGGGGSGYHLGNSWALFDWIFIVIRTLIYSEVCNFRHKDCIQTFHSVFDKEPFSIWWNSGFGCASGYKTCLQCWKHDSALHTIAIIAKTYLFISLLLCLELNCWDFKLEKTDFREESIPSNDTVSFSSELRWIFKHFF